MTTLRWGSATDVGRRRTNQEDTLLAEEPLFAVADGMGGHAGGEVASSTAIAALRAAYRSGEIEEAVDQANAAVQERAASDTDLRSMGTTLAVVALTPSDDGDVFTVANVGDSRIYLLRDGELSQLTEDHSVPQELYRAGQLTQAEAAVDPRKNIITRALGMAGVEPDVQTLVPFRGDRLLLCSDGLTDEVGDDEIASILRRVPDPDDAARTLVETANRNGGRDNISVVVVDVVDDDDRSAVASAALADDPSRTGGGSRLMSAAERDAELRALATTDANAAPTSTPERLQHEPPPRRMTVRVLAFLVVLLLVLGGAVAAVGWYARGTYYVGLDGDRIVIFRGRPGGLLWFDPTIEDRTNLTTADILPARLDDLRSGKEEPGLDDARRYVQNLRDEATAANPAPQAAAEDPAASTTTVAPEPAPTSPPP